MTRNNKMKKRKREVNETEELMMMEKVEESSCEEGSFREMKENKEKGRLSIEKDDKQK